jgi:hypothetical protein
MLLKITVVDQDTATKLIAAIITFVKQKGSYVTKTKLLKLLYLFDVEYFRAHRTTFTGFTWKYLHLGPWAAEYDPTLDGLLASGALNETFAKNDARYLNSPARIETGAAFVSAKDEGILRYVLRIWGPLSTGEILDAVYFTSEPMEHAIRNEPLDFSVISSVPAPQYKRQPSGVSEPEIRKRRAQFEAKKVGPPTNSRTGKFTPPNYDEDFAQAIAIIDAEG